MKNNNNMRIVIFTFMLLSISFVGLNAQMVEDDGTVKYGNEWIDYDKEYYKIPIAVDGIHRITYQQLVGSGIDINNVEGKDFQLFVYGKEVPLYTSTSSVFGSDDYIEFYGEKNRSQMDYYLFRERGGILNPEYSLFSDIATYYLTWSKDSDNSRFVEKENDISGNLPEKEEYYIHDEKLVFSSKFNKPVENNSYHTKQSDFVRGEGFGTPLQISNTFSFQTSNFINVGIKPELSFRYTTSNGKHIINIYVNDELLKSFNREGKICEVFKKNISFNSFTDNMTVKTEGTFHTDLNDRMAISVADLKYTREFDFQDKTYFKFNIESSPFERYFEIENFNYSGGSILLYDIKNNERLIPKIDNDKVLFVLEPSENDREFVLINATTDISSVNTMDKVEFKDYEQLKDKNYIIISDLDAFIDENGTNWVDEYENYRSSEEGRGFNTLKVDVKDIYDNFGYGIANHSQAINNFIIYVKDHFTNPEYIFIIGKGLEYNEIRTEDQLNDPNKKFFVPTYGYPGSDNLLAARYNTNDPIIAIGRIAVRNYSQIKKYLNKVKIQARYEDFAQTLGEKEWMKKVIHLVGGHGKLVEQIRTALKEMSEIIEENKFGGFTHSYERKSGTAQETVTQKIIDDITQGAAIVTFYGHSGVSGTDFNISHFENDNRFPVFYSLGCYSGNIHTTSNEGQSENFVLNDKGVIAYVGTSGTGFTGVLPRLGKNIYNNTGTMYEQGLGKIIRKSIEQMGDVNDHRFVILKQQFTFHGDPAVTINPHYGPDYTIDFSTINTEPSVIQSSSENFELNFDIVNLGYNIQDSLKVQVLRTLPSGKTDTIIKKIKSPAAREKFSLKLPTKGTDARGQNCFSAFLDPNNEIEEFISPEAEENNSFSDNSGNTDYCFNIVNPGAEPIYPEEFSIVNNKNLKLQASTYSYFINSRDYIFEIDTTELFDSPLKKSNIVNSKGGMIEWTPNIDLEHNRVYYWRISPDSTGVNSPYIWENSSFIYLENGSEGWNQSHYFQYLKDDGEGIKVNKRRDFEFDLSYYGVEIEGRKYDPANKRVVRINGAGWRAVNPVTKRPCIAIIGWGLSAKAIVSNLNGNYGNMSGTANYVYCFKMKEKEQRIGIKDLLEDIPDSIIVSIHTILDSDVSNGLNTEDWANDSITEGYNIFSVLESYGAKKIRLMETKGTVPYVFVFKKGAGVIEERIGKTFNDKFLVEFNTSLPKKKGSFKSVTIGPAKEWNKLVWREDSNTKYPEDTTQLFVYKLNKSLTDKVLIDSLNSVSELELQNINSNLYPYLKLEWKLQDKFDRTPPNLDFWRVYYTGFPDAILVNNEDSYFNSDTLDYGDILKFRTKVINNTSYDMDSLLVKYTIRKENNEQIVKYKRYAPLKSNTSYYIDFEHTTVGLVGINEFGVEINPDKDQQEKYRFNNIGTKRFYVRNDINNPMMDVTFNGEHIMDGDLVRPKSEITVRLRDDNKYLLLNDKKIFKKFSFITPSENKIDVDVENDPEITFEPATSVDNNEAILRFNHFFDEEGEYQLIVQATDITGNLSGENDYKISFKIILKEQISNVYNYPNPFTTKTKFLFDLTGVEMPESIVIKIMTLSGKIVRELTNVDLGEFKFGKNISKNAWDGTDEFGRKLANGVYLYKVTAVNAAGKEFELMKREGENDDKYFKKGFGKLVILDRNYRIQTFYV